MKEQDQILALTKLDGWTFEHGVDFDTFQGKLRCSNSYGSILYIPDYLHSRDAIVPLIEKHWHSLLNGKEPTLESEGFLVRFGEICEELCHDEVSWTITPFYRFVLMKPSQLSEALLRALNLWKE